ncbi:TRAP transporter small permease [Alteribacillus sp. JSM 102045]|uniref:TRAP transporter small permease n=1 Tax=Alteribacillus sp. JSM 102045 TaxID=1562101 RepID=UPI0035BEC3AC
MNGRTSHKGLLYIKKILSRCEFVLLVLSCISVFIMVIIMTYGVIGRQFFNSSVLWATEASTFLMVYLTFLSMPWILQIGGHVKIDIFVASLSRKKLKFLNILVYTLCTIAMAIFFWYSLNITIDSFQRGTVLLDSVSWPEYLLMLPIPVGSFFLTVRFILFLLEIFYEFDKDKEKLNKEVEIPKK